MMNDIPSSQVRKEEVDQHDTDTYPPNYSITITSPQGDYAGSLVCKLLVQGSDIELDDELNFSIVSPKVHVPRPIHPPPHEGILSNTFNVLSLSPFLLYPLPSIW